MGIGRFLKSIVNNEVMGEEIVNHNKEWQLPLSSRSLNTKFILKLGFLLGLAALVGGGAHAASITTVDDKGNKYILSDDGTYKKLKEKSLSYKEVAERTVAVIRTYRKMKKKGLSDSEAKCIKSLVLSNAGKKFEDLNFMNPKWGKYADWLATLPIKDGLVINEMKVAGSTLYFGMVKTGEEQCGIK